MASAWQLTGSPRSRAGARVGQVYAALHAYGRTVPAGCGPTVGITGLTLGGGIGLLGRNHGLTCDRLVGAQVVLADGSVVDCDHDREPDLFWGLRGAGGGQFGVVTSPYHDLKPPTSEPADDRFALTSSASQGPGGQPVHRDGRGLQSTPPRSRTARALPGRHVADAAPVGRPFRRPCASGARDPPALRGDPMILVTGGLGMIGAHTACALADLGHEVAVTANRRTEVPSFLAGRVTVESSTSPTGTPFSPSGRHDISDIVHLGGTRTLRCPQSRSRTSSSPSRRPSSSPAAAARGVQPASSRTEPCRRSPPACGSTSGPDGRPARRQPLPRHHPAHQRNRLRPVLRHRSGGRRLRRLARRQPR